LDRVTPAVDSAVKKVRPVVDETLERVTPTVDLARDRVQNDFLPWLVAALYKAADLVKEEVEEIKPEPKRRSVGKTIGLIALAGAVLAGVVYAVRKLLAGPEASWETHEPSRPYVADPVADVVDKAKDAAAAATDAVAEKLSDAKDAAADAVDKAKDAAGDAVQAAKDAASDAKDAAADLADDAEEVGEEALDKAGEAIDEAKQAAAEVLDDVSDEAKGAAEEVGEAVEDVKEKAKDAKGDASPLADSPYGEGSYVGAEPPEDYIIKGNERSMKYHLQGSGGYERTITDVWFNSAEAAERAGFVRAQR
nr:hypothetical protein [Micropruina sp.]